MSPNQILNKLMQNTKSWRQKRKLSEFKTLENNSTMEILSPSTISVSTCTTTTSWSSLVITVQVKPPPSQCSQACSNPALVSSKFLDKPNYKKSDKILVFVLSMTLFMKTSQLRNIWSFLEPSKAWLGNNLMKKSKNSSLMSTYWKKKTSIQRTCQEVRKDVSQSPWHSLVDQKSSFWMNRPQVWTHQPEDIFGNY